MVLVTGGSGLVGNEVINQLLNSGYEVRATVHKTPLQGRNNKHIHEVTCDILDIASLESALQGVDAVYHCAGLISFKKGTTADLYKVNVEGTANLVNVSLDAGIRKLVHVSSVAAIGNRQLKSVIHEEMPLVEHSGSSKYSKAKYLAEMEVWRGIAEGLNAVIVNPSIIFGFGNWDNGSMSIFKNVYKQFPWYANGENGFVDVRDVAKAMIMLMNSSISAERFILSGTNTSYRDLCFKIADEFKVKRPYKKINPWLASLVWRLESVKSFVSGKDALVTKETAATALACINYNNEKLLEAFPEFEYRSLDQSIKDICSYLQQNINKR